MTCLSSCRSTKAATTCTAVGWALTVACGAPKYRPRAIRALSGVRLPTASNATPSRPPPPLPISLLAPPSTLGLRATPDAATIVNLAHPSYLNLGGHESGSILGHLAEIRSSFYIPVDDELLPTGEVLGVEGTPFDFRQPTR